MRLQQMLFAAFASTVLLIGGPDAPQAVASSEMTPIIEMQTKTNVEAFNSSETTTTIRYMKQLFSQLTSYFMLNQMREEIHTSHESTRLQTNFSDALVKLLSTDDLYPSSYKGIETFIKEEQIIIHGELRPLNI